MIRLAVAGAAHPHVAYATAEVGNGCELVAVADPDRGLARKWATPYGAAVYTDHREMLRAVEADVVMVAGIYGDRGRAVVDALEAGCHVIADKPLCTTLDDLDAIAAAVRRTKRYVTLLLEKRYYPETLAALELVRAGRIGTIHGVVSSGPHKLNRPTRPGWFFERERYGGILNDLAVHDIDAALLFTGLQSGTVSGAVAGSTYGVATLTGPGTVVTAGVDWLNPAGSPVHGDYRMKLIGTEGTAELLWAQHRLVLTTSELAPHDVPLPAGRRPAELPLQALAAGNQPDISTEAGLLATRIALLAQQSAENGGAALPWSAQGSSSAASGLPGGSVDS